MNTYPSYEPDSHHEYQLNRISDQIVDEHPRVNREHQLSSVFPKLLTKLHWVNQLDSSHSNSSCRIQQMTRIRISFLVVQTNKDH